MIPRHHYFANILSNPNPICALLGPRQCGKTTLAKQFIEHMGIKAYFFDLEDPDHYQAFQHPKLLLGSLEGWIVIDEIQRLPHIFPYLRTLVDQKPNIKLLILGSTSKDLIQQASETLAGRIRYIEVTPFSYKEVDNLNQLWVRGGFPKSYLAANDAESFEWRKDYIRTFLEQDIPNLGFKLSPQQLRRFWMMLCDYHGNIFNASELGRALDVNHKTIKSYLDILLSTFMVYSLEPWFANISKRQVKSPKIYFQDSGLFHALLRIPDFVGINESVKVGPSWEGFAMGQVIQYHQAEREDCFFWSAQSSAEVDLLIVHSQKKYAFEFKYSSSPAVTKSMRVAMEALELDSLNVIVPGNAHYFLDHNIVVYGLSRYLTKPR